MGTVLRAIVFETATSGHFDEVARFDFGKDYALSICLHETKELLRDSHAAYDLVMSYLAEEDRDWCNYQLLGVAELPAPSTVYGKPPWNQYNQTLYKAFVAFVQELAPEFAQLNILFFTDQ